MNEILLRSAAALGLDGCSGFCFGSGMKNLPYSFMPRKVADEYFFLQRAPVVQHWNDCCVITCAPDDDESIAGLS